MSTFAPEVKLAFPADPYPVHLAPGSPLGQRVLDCIGDTPLLRLAHVAKPFPGVQILGKAEWHNPGGSVKDRAAWNIVSEACQAGQLGPGKMLLDSTSGNTGIAYAMLGAAMGFPVTLCVPKNVSPERKRILESYGATILWTDPDLGSDGAIRKVREVYAADPEKLLTQWKQSWPFPDLHFKSERWVEPDMEDVFTAYSQGYDAVLKDRPK